MKYVVVTKDQVRAMRKGLGMPDDPKAKGWRLSLDEEKACHRFGMKPWLGKHHSEETKAKMSDTMKSISYENYCKPKSKKHRRNISLHASKTRWYNDGVKTYKLIPEVAATRPGLQPGPLKKVV
jgi:hypothetical protein